MIVNFSKILLWVGVFVMFGQALCENLLWLLGNGQDQWFMFSRMTALTVFAGLLGIISLLEGKDSRLKK